MNPLQQLRERGQSVWIDFIDRDLIESGELKRLIDKDGLGGLTSNPKIFKKAMAEGEQYDEQIRQLLQANPDIETTALFEALAIVDIRAAADILRTVYDRTDGRDGFVSLEVSPRLAYDTEATIAEARRLWETVERPNVLIKVPATDEGIPAVETLLGEGVNVNITLMFSLHHYEAVAQAYLRALRKTPQPERIASVASFFLSRITTLVDKRLDDVGSPEAIALKGKIAIANAKQTYQRFCEIFRGPDFAELQRHGARPQRVLWASTRTKNPAYSDVMYVEELIGPETVNTMPPDTIDAFRDHGRVRGDTVETDLDQASAQLEQLAKTGVDLDEVAQQLQTEGVEKFRKPFDELIDALENKQQQLLARHQGARLWLIALKKRNALTKPSGGSLTNN